VPRDLSIRKEFKKNHYNNVVGGAIASAAISNEYRNVVEMSYNDEH